MSNKTIKVALIEDDIGILKMYLTKLEMEGFEVRVASDGATGLELIKDFKPDAVLLDVMMPEVTGVEMLSQLRRLSKYDPVKVFVLTNLDDPKLAKSLKQMGITDYIVKAETTPGEIVDKIKTALGSQTAKS